MVKKAVVCAMLVFVATAFGEMIESMHFSDIQQYADKDTLLLLDIDNTLMETTQELGNDQWFHHQIGKYIEKGIEPAAALEKALAEWNAIQNVTGVKIVEAGTEAIIQDLQDQGYTVMGLTTRGLGLSQRTIDQLYSLNIDLSITPPSSDEVYFMNKQGVLFRKGILFTSGTNKGKALVKFLNAIGYFPKAIVFINDKASHILDLEKGCIELGIPFVGLRYGYLDDKVAQFRADLAEIEFKHFGSILSDSEAKSMLDESTLSQ